MGISAVQPFVFIQQQEAIRLSGEAHRCDVRQSLDCETAKLRDTLGNRVYEIMRMKFAASIRGTLQRRSDAVERMESTVAAEQRELEIRRSQINGQNCTHGRQRLQRILWWMDQVRVV